jgi:DeoR/GlpR family transcriptional regulator of sugar metabolism
MKHAAEKEEIAQTALALIRENDVIALDSGSTTLAIAKALPNMPVTVVVNDLRVIAELMGKDQVQLVVPGGYRVRNSLVSPESVSYLKGFNIGIAFVAATAIHLDYGLSNYVGDLIEYKKALVETAQRVYAVVDHSKFGQSALQTYALLKEIDAVITDSGLPEETARTFRDKGVTLLAKNQ